MKGFLVGIVVGASAMYFWNERDVDAPLPVSADVPITQERSVATITCHHCRGEKKLIDNSGVISIGYRCPICDGAGSIIRPPDPCSHCRGFGKVPRNRSQLGRSSRLVVQPCPICQSSGRSL